MSLRDYPCHRPVRVVSSAAQAAAVVPPVCRHGEMLRLINRRQYCSMSYGGAVKVSCDDSPVLRRCLELDESFGEQLEDNSPASEEEGR